MAIETEALGLFLREFKYDDEAGKAFAYGFFKAR